MDGDCDIIVGQSSLSWLSDPATSAFALAQTGGALRHSADVDAACIALEIAGLPVHPDKPKNWDTFLAVWHALASTQQDAPVLDAGAERYSAFLPSLQRLGYDSLTGINLALDRAEINGAVQLEPGDITATRFSPASFAYAACLSVIEHGVDIPRFVAEVARILRPGGRLFVSFDYWHQPVDTRGQEAYGVPIRIFTPADVSGLLGAAAKVGLFPAHSGDLRCVERVAHWARFGLSYTFANLLLRRA